MPAKPRQGFVDDTRRHFWNEGAFCTLLTEGEPLIRGTDIWVSYPRHFVSTPGHNKATVTKTGAHYRPTTTGYVHVPLADIDNLSIEDIKKQLDSQFPPPMVPCPYKEYLNDQHQGTILMVEALAEHARVLPYGSDADILRTILPSAAYTAMMDT